MKPLLGGRKGVGALPRRGVPKPSAPTPNASAIVAHQGEAKPVTEGVQVQRKGAGGANTTAGDQAPPPDPCCLSPTTSGEPPKPTSPAPDVKGTS
jgi:hypothetical protein